MTNHEDDQLISDIMKSLEAETGTKIFTIKVLEGIKNDEDDGGTLNVLVVFEDKSVMKGEILVQVGDDKELEVRIRGNYL